MTILLLLVNANRRHCRRRCPVNRIGHKYKYYRFKQCFFFSLFETEIVRDPRLSWVGALARSPSRPSDDRLGQTRCTNHIIIISIYHLQSLRIKSRPIVVSIG